MVIFIYVSAAREHNLIDCISLDNRQKLVRIEIIVLTKRPIMSYIYQIASDQVIQEYGVNGLRFEHFR